MTGEITVRASDKPDITPAKLAMYEQNHPLDAFFVPKTVAVIGATESAGSMGRTALWNLLSNPFGGMVFPVNPNRGSVLGIKSYKTINEIPVPVDLAIIATPAHTTLGIVRECVEANVKGAIILSAGFKEKGEEGAALEQQILLEARKGKMRLLGPNCTGLMYTPTGLNAAFTKKMALPGTVGFISQSGALSNAVLDWSLQENVGFSAFVTVGSMLDVGWGDIIQYLGNDHRTHSIIIYMETLDDVRSFLSATRAVALTKPVIVMKGGSSHAGQAATSSHTGSLVGSDAVLDAAFNRTGVLRVHKISELFDMAEVLGKQPRPNGSRLTILTNAGAPGIIATDALVNGGGTLAPLSPEIQAELNAVLPPHWSHNNPIDILGDATPERYEKALEIAMKNPDSDGLLVILAPQAVIADPTETANRLVQLAKKQRVPILASWMGGDEVADGQNILNHAQIPTYPYPDTGSRLFNYMWQYNASLRNLYETPNSTPDAKGEAEKAATIIEAARAAGRTMLTEYESKQILEAYGINTVKTSLAKDEDEAVRMADDCGYPVAVKLNSHTISHKSAVGGVKLNIPDAAGVRRAYQTIKELTGDDFFGVTVQPMVLEQEGYELIVGSSIDEQFGPVILFGAGGTLVEIYNDKSLGLPPLNTSLARHMMEQTRIFSALNGASGGHKVNLAELEQVMVLFSRLVIEQRWIKEIDINPLLVSPERIVALDALIVLHDPEVTEAELPRLAIRPYPTEYVNNWTLKDGTPVVVRPIRPEDEPLVVKFHSNVSERSVYFRYLHMLSLMQRVSHERLTRICFIDYDREMALVAVYTHPDTGEQEIIGIGRLNKLHGRDEAEFALLVSDNWQGRGLGKAFLTRLVEVGKLEGMSKIEGFIHPENMDMQRVSEKVGFKRSYSIEDGLVKVVMNI